MLCSFVRIILIVFYFLIRIIRIYCSNIIIFNILKSMEKSYWLFVYGTRVMLTYWLAYKIASSLNNSI